MSDVAKEWSLAEGYQLDQHNCARSAVPLCRCGGSAEVMGGCGGL